MKHKAILGLGSGIALVVVTLVGVASFGPPRPAVAGVRLGKLPSCPLAEVSLDPGYGVSSKALVPVCAAEAGAP